MKTAILPQVRIEPALRAELESVLNDDETLSGFVEASVRGAVAYRRAQAEFHARGQAAWEAVQRGGATHPAQDVVDELRGMLDARRQSLRKKAGTPPP